MIDDEWRARLIKICSCGEKYTQRQWERLEYVGIQHSHDDTGVYATELRNCPKCKSTMAIERQVTR